MAEVNADEDGSNYIATFTLVLIENPKPSTKSMEETLIRSEEANYLPGVKMIIGTLMLTNQRLLFSGTQFHIKEEEGTIMYHFDKALNINQFSEEEYINLPLNGVTCEIKRHGLTKVVLVTDPEGNRYKLAVKKSQRQEWVDAISNARDQLGNKH